MIRKQIIIKWENRIWIGRQKNICSLIPLVENYTDIINNKKKKKNKERGQTLLKPWRASITKVEYSENGKSVICMNRSSISLIQLQGF